MTTPQRYLALRLELAVCLLLSSLALAGDAAAPSGPPVLERPTLHSLGVYWIIPGDDNVNAVVELEYRKTGESAWRSGAPMFRVDKGTHMAEKYGSKLDVPKTAWLFAGSAVLLEPDTAYELRVGIDDPDGGSATHTLAARTRTEPIAPKDLPVLHVVPGAGGGTGTQQDPIKGLAAAAKAARPGTLVLLHAGTYEGNTELACDGAPSKPIVFRAADDGKVILDGQGSAAKRPGRVLGLSGRHDLYFEGLTVRRADWGIVAHDSARIVIRRCRIHDVNYGITATRNSRGDVEDFFIADNVIEGPSTWPRTKGIENARGIQITGAGHVVCYNRIRGFADAIDTFGSIRCEAIDIHNNDLYELTDDGIEMDYSHRNTRCFFNRMTNVFQGISVQPVFGGPVYVFRNAMYNVCVEPFKIHNSPSGAIFYHNTVVKKGPPMVVMTNEPAGNIHFRNNLFIGTASSGYAWEQQPKMTNSSADYDGFGGGPFKMFLKWNGQRFATFEDMKSKSPIEKHATLVKNEGCFASGALPPADEKKQAELVDLRLAEKSNAVDAGCPLSGFNDGFAGKAPDLGAYEVAAPLPWYGPRKP